MFTDHKQKKSHIWDVLYLTSNQKLQLEEHGPEIVFIKGIHITIADQSHGLSMTPASIKQLRATLQQQSIRSKCSQRQNWTAVIIQWCKLKVVTSKHGDCNLMFTKPRKGGWNIPSNRDSKPQNKDQRSIVTSCTNTYKGFAFSTHWEHNSVVGRLDMYRTKVLMYRTMVLMARLTNVRR